MTNVYHLHIHGKYLPQLKKVLPTRKQAEAMFQAMMSKHFSYDSVKQYIKGPSNRLFATYNTVISNGYTITSIDTHTCPEYERLFLEQPLTLNTNLLAEIAENRNEFGDVEPFIKGD